MFKNASKLALLAFLASVLAVSSADQALAIKKSESTCWKLYKFRYLKEKGPKAMATTAGRPIPRDDTSCGFATATNLAAAKADALQQCNRWSKSQGHKERCKIFHSSTK